jgi:hypothetical protein
MKLKMLTQQLRPRLQRSALYALGLGLLVLAILMHVPAELQPADRLRVLWLLFVVIVMSKVYLESEVVNVFIGILGPILLIVTAIYFKSPIMAFFSQPIAGFPLGNVLAVISMLGLFTGAVYWDFFRKKTS